MGSDGCFLNIEATLETQIAWWRSWMRERNTGTSKDLDELEDRLRSQLKELQLTGLTEDESFLIALRRMGSRDSLSRAFAQEHAERLWKQLLLPDQLAKPSRRRELWVALGIGIAAAIAIKLPLAFGIDFDEIGDDWYFRNAALLVLPFLAGWFFYQRRTSLWRGGLLAIPAICLAVAINAYPFAPHAQTLVLAATHLPIALWALVGIAYAGPHWQSHTMRMQFVRFTGEWIIYYALIALGGMTLVLTSLALSTVIFGSPQEWLADWLMPAGAAGAVIIAAYLVHAKQRIVENMAPVLTKLFTPLFTIVLSAFLLAMLWKRNLLAIDRDALIVFDIVLVVVLGLVVYANSARGALTHPDAIDAIQFILVVTALLADVGGVAAMVARIAALGSTPNRVAALGLNGLLLIHLGIAAWLQLGFLQRRRPFAVIERWHTSYLPVYAIWAAFLVFLLPPAYRFA